MKIVGLPCGVVKDSKIEGRRSFDEHGKGYYHWVLVPTEIDLHYNQYFLSL